MVQSYLSTKQIETQRKIEEVQQKKKKKAKEDVVKATRKMIKQTNDLAEMCRDAGSCYYDFPPEAVNTLKNIANRIEAYSEDLSKAIKNIK